MIPLWLNEVWRSERQQEILAIMSDEKPRTEEQIMYELNLIKRNTFAYRMGELKNLGLIVETGERVQTKGGGTAKLLKIDYSAVNNAPIHNPSILPSNQRWM